MGRKRKGLKLKVFLNATSVGYLEKTATGAVSFQYDESWLASKNAMPISMSLPLRPEKYSGSVAYNFFENLLPDGPSVRKIIAQRMGAESAELLDLIRVIGRDCVGALQFLAENTESPPILPEVSGEKLSYAQVEKILTNLTRNPLGLEKHSDFRISVAGVQEKTALLRMNGQWYRPQGSVPTSHILKKSMGLLLNGIDMTESVQNEWLCLQICRKLGLEVANAEVVQFGQTEALVVERFDRKWSDDNKALFRLPTEDLCQALGVNTATKYENEGGPGIVRIMNLLNTSNFREKDRKNFFKAQLVFHLLSAVDGHAKNFSLFLGPRGMHLTPLYDVLTAFPALAERQIEKKQLKLAMAVGKNRKYRLHDIQQRHWYETAHLANFNTEYVDDILHELSSALDKLNFRKNELPKNFSEPLLESVFDALHHFRKQVLGS